MEVRFTPEQEAELARLAMRAGKEPSEFVQETIARMLGDHARFLEAVERGFDSLDQGRYVSHEEVGKRIESLLR